MKRLVAALIVATIVAIAAVRRRVPSYPSWSEYLADDSEGDAMPADPYLDGLR